MDDESFSSFLCPTLVLAQGELFVRNFRVSKMRLCTRTSRAKVDEVVRACPQRQHRLVTTVRFQMWTLGQFKRTRARFLWLSQRALDRPQRPDTSLQEHSQKPTRYSLNREPKCRWTLVSAVVRLPPTDVWRRALRSRLVTKAVSGPIWTIDRVLKEPHRDRARIV